MNLLNKKWLVIGILCLSGCLGFIFSYYRYHHLFISKNDIVTIQTFDYPALFASQLRHDPDAGRKIFKQFCSSCHGKQPLIDIQAPRINDKNAWNERRKMGVDRLLKITTTGIGAMPARGGCFECSDDELRETIEYMLNQ